MNIIYTNAQSLTKNIESFRELINEKKPHLLCLSETHVTTDIIDNEIKIDEYKCIRCDSNSRHTGGVVMYIKEGIKFKLVKIVALVKTWFIAIQIEESNLQISVIYNSPSQRINDFFNILDEFISLNLDYNCQQILVGDININVARNTKNVKEYYDLIKEHNLKQIVNEYTRFDAKNNISTIIDHILTNNDKTSYEVNRIDKISDHYLVQIKYNECVKVESEQSYRNVIRGYSKDTFCKLIEEKYINENVENLQSFFKTIESALLTFVKNEKIRKKKFKFNENLMKLKNDKNSAYNRYLMSGTSEDYEIYKTINKEYKYNLSMTKNNEFREKLVMNKNDPKKLWRNIKSLYKSDNEKINYIRIDNEVFDISQIIANKLNESFINSIAEIVNKIEKPKRSDYLELIKKPDNKFELVTIDKENLLLFLNVIKDKRFDDNISGGNLVDIGNNEKLNELLLKFINKTIIESQMPQCFKTSVISPIPKIVNPCKPEDFRPINNLPVGEKLIENIVHNQLVKFLEDNDIICENQHGFRESHSTETALIKLTDHLVKNNENGLVTVTVFLDFKRAFETVNREILLKKLRCYNFSDDTIKWFESYLTDRKQKVKVNGIYSMEVLVKEGVPQGSKVSNTLFSLYINDMVKVVDCDVLMYADDTLLSISAETSKEACEKMNIELDKLHDWLKYNKISLNIKKCNYMIFNDNSNSDVESCNISIDDVKLEKIEQTKYLGVIIDNKLKFNDHGESIISKMNKKLGLFRRISFKLNEENKILYYKSIIQPHIDYCSFIFNFMDQRIRDRLQIIQNKCMRVINRDDINLIREKYKIVLVDKRIKVNVIKSLKRILVKEKPISVNKLFQTNNQRRIRNLRYNDDLAIPRYLNKHNQKSFVYVASMELNKINKYIFENNLSKNNFINNCIKYYE